MKHDTPCKLLIVEDHELAKNGLIFSLKPYAGFEVIGSAGDGRQAIGLVDERMPDIVLIDIGLPVMDGIEATHRIKAKHPHTKVVVLTSRQEKNEVYASLASGADAYCMKDISTERLVEVLKMVRDGAFWLDPSIAGLVMNTLRLKLESVTGLLPSTTKRNQTELTDREMDVLKLLVNGENNKDIASKLNIAINTVKAHVANIIQKMAVDDRTQAALKALREGIVTQ